MTERFHKLKCNLNLYFHQNTPKFFFAFSFISQRLLHAEVSMIFDLLAVLTQFSLPSVLVNAFPGFCCCCVLLIEDFIALCGLLYSGYRHFAYILFCSLYKQTFYVRTFYCVSFLLRPLFTLSFRNLFNDSFFVTHACRF